MYDTNRFIHAAEPCAYREAFAEDMRRCDNALGMGGLMGYLLSRLQNADAYYQCSLQG